MLLLVPKPTGAPPFAYMPRGLNPGAAAGSFAMLWLAPKPTGAPPPPHMGARGLYGAGSAAMLWLAPKPTECAPPLVAPIGATAPYGFLCDDGITATLALDARPRGVTGRLEPSVGSVP